MTPTPPAGDGVLPATGAGDAQWFLAIAIVAVGLGALFAARRRRTGGA